MNTPLNDLKQWFLALESSCQNTLGLWVDQFFLKPESFEKQHGQIYRFLPQLEVADSDANIIIQKTLYFIKVFDFCIDGFSREENWQLRLDMLLETHLDYTKKGMPEIGDEMLNNFYENKNRWFAVAESWTAITNDVLSNNIINKWFLQELIKQVRR
jgi:hypothetical protein